MLITMSELISIQKDIGFKCCVGVTAEPTGLLIGAFGIGGSAPTYSELLSFEDMKECDPEVLLKEFSNNARDYFIANL